MTWTPAPPARDIFVTQTANSITVRWAAKLQGTSTDVNVAMTLFSDGKIRFDYGAGNTGLTPTVGVSAGNGTAYVLAGYDGQSSLASANSLLWTPTPGLVYYDIGAYEFQGSSGDTTGPQVVSISQLAGQRRQDGAGFLGGAGRVQRVAQRRLRPQPGQLRVARRRRRRHVRHRRRRHRQGHAVLLLPRDQADAELRRPAGRGQVPPHAVRHQGHLRHRRQPAGR